MFGPFDILFDHNGFALIMEKPSKPSNLFFVCLQVFSSYRNKYQFPSEDQ